MPVDSTHPEYDKALPDWKIMGDVLAGARAVKAKGTEYLPKLSGQKDEEYLAYQKRALFLGATGKSAEAFVGFMFRRNPEVTLPATGGPMVGIVSDFTMTGISLYDYTRRISEAVIQKGRAGTLIDFSDQEQRPFVVQYEETDIINWTVSRIAGKMMLSRLVLHEKDTTPMPDSEAKVQANVDPFIHVSFDQWRVLTLEADGEGEPFVKVEVWRRKPSQTRGTPGEWVRINQVFPTRRGIGLNRIPFVFHNMADCQPAVGKIPLLDMAHVNLSHYMTSADLENGRHVTGLPTPYCFGIDVAKNGGFLQLGSNVAWVSDNADAKAGFVEFNGEGLGALEKAMAEKEKQMAALGAKMLEPEAKKAEAFDTVEMRNNAETSALSKIAGSVSAGVSDAMQWCAWWIGTEADPEDLNETVRTSISQDYVSTRMKPEELAQLTATWMAGAIDFPTFFWNLQRGEMIEPGRTMDEVRKEIADNPPTGTGPHSEPAPEPAPGK